MKTSITRINRSAGVSLLDWPDGVPSRLGEAIISRPKFRKQAKNPELRIVSEVGNDDLFKYATAAKNGIVFWETIAFLAVALSAVGALAVAFGI
jgi:hypothetical protein